MVLSPLIEQVGIRMYVVFCFFATSVMSSSGGLGQGEEVISESDLPSPFASLRLQGGPVGKNTPRCLIGADSFGDGSTLWSARDACAFFCGKQIGHIPAHIQLYIHPLAERVSVITLCAAVPSKIVKWCVSCGGGMFRTSLVSRFSTDEIGSKSHTEVMLHLSTEWCGSCCATLRTSLAPQWSLIVGQILEGVMDEVTWHMSSSMWCVSCWSREELSEQQLFDGSPRMSKYLTELWKKLLGTCPSDSSYCFWSVVASRNYFYACG